MLKQCGQQGVVINEESNKIIVNLENNKLC